MLDALLAMAAAYAKTKGPDAALGALSAGAKLFAAPAKRRATQWLHTRTGAPRPRDLALERAVYVAFYGSIAERLETAAGEYSALAREASVDRSPAAMLELERRRALMEAGRQAGDGLSLSAASKFDDASAEPVDWHGDALSALAEHIVWPPREQPWRSTLAPDLAQVLCTLASRRAGVLARASSSDQGLIDELFVPNGGEKDWLSAYARHFSHLACTRDTVWRPLIATRLDELVGELRGTLVEMAREERSAITTAIQRYGLTEPRQWLARVERVRRELRGEGERTETRVFGGRAAELAALDDWFDSDSSERHLVVGRSGVGKSVLVQHWTDRRALDADVEVMHIPLLRTPIDTADGDRALLYLCARIGAQVAQHPVQLRTHSLQDLGDSLETLLSHINGKRMLIAIDGLDELHDPSAFIQCLPTSLPNGVKLLLSARIMAGEQGAAMWIKALGLADQPSEVTHLEPLGRKAMSQALAEAGYAPEASSFSKLVDRVLWLTDGGDPLLFAFLRADEARFRDLASEAESGLNLEGWRSGYRGLLERWIDDAVASMQSGGIGHEQRQICFAALAAIAAAPAPVGDSELLRVLRRCCEPRLLTLKGVLDPPRRRLVGNGQSSYGFSHPRLAEVVMTPDVLMDKDALQSVKSTYGEWFTEEAKAAANGSASFHPYAATHALGYLLQRTNTGVDPVPEIITGPMLAALRRSGRLLSAMSSIGMHLADSAWKNVDGSPASRRLLLNRLMRLGLFKGSAPRPLYVREATPVLARAVKIGALSSAEAFSWAYDADDHLVGESAWPEEQGWMQVHVEPEAYHLPRLYGALDQSTRDEVLRMARRLLDGNWPRAEYSEFPDEYWAWLGTLLLRVAVELESQCGAAEEMLSTLPSWRAARCMLCVASDLPKKADWFALTAQRVRISTAAHDESGAQSFDEEYAWLQLGGEKLDAHAERLLPLLSDWRSITGWPAPTGSTVKPDLDRLSRLAILAQHSSEARAQALALLRNTAPFRTREWAEAVAKLGKDDVDVEAAVEIGGSTVTDRDGREPIAAIAAGLYGGLAQVPEDEWNNLLHARADLARGIQARDLEGLGEQRIAQLEASAEKLDGMERTKALCALASSSDSIVRRLILEWQSTSSWLYDDEIVARTLARATVGPRQRLLRRLRESASRIVGKLYARAFAATPLADASLLLDLIHDLPDTTLRAHLAMQLVDKAPLMMSDARVAIGDDQCAAAQLVRAMWDGARWSSLPTDAPPIQAGDMQMREFLQDWLPKVLSVGFHADPQIRGLLRGEDWLSLVRRLDLSVVAPILERPFDSVARYGDPAGAILAAGIARNEAFSAISARSALLQETEWAGAIAAGITASAVPEAKRAIEYLFQFDGSGRWHTGGSWKHLVNGLISDHPDEIGWFIQLWERSGRQLDQFEFLPALARSQSASSIEALAAHGLKAERICLMLLSSDDLPTRRIGHRRLAEALAAGDRLPVEQTKYEDDLPFTAKAVLAGLLAECDDAGTVQVAVRALHRDSVRWYGESIDSSLDISSLISEWLRRAQGQVAAELADDVCELMIEFLS